MENYLSQKTHLQSLLFLILLISSSNLPIVKSQPADNNNNNNNDQYPYQNFSPSIAIIIVVLVAALFFMGFFSIYIRRCSDSESGGNTVRNILSIHARRANAAAQHGLDESVLETFPTFSYAEVKDHKVGKGALECAVCLNEFEDDETLRLIPKCDHVFHAECIDAWLENHVTCPVCRADVSAGAGDEPYHLPELSREPVGVSAEAVGNEEVVNIQIDSQGVKPEVNRNSSFGNSNNRPPRAESLRGGRRNLFGLEKFRSHSTGHSLVQPGENLDRFTLKLPQEIRKEMMNRALLNRTKSLAARLASDGSTRRGGRTGVGDESNRGGRSFRRIEQTDRAARSDRWLFSAPLFSRAISMKSTKVVADNSEGSTSRGVKTAVKIPSFKCLEPKTTDDYESSLIRADSARPPV